MDKITSSLVKDLLGSFELQSKSESLDFEFFCTYAILSREYSEKIEEEVISDAMLRDDPDAKENHDGGIDSIAVMANGQIINTKEEMDELKDQVTNLDIKFIFVQSKTSPSFDAKEIGGFCFGVEDFFSSKPKLKRSELLEKKSKLANYVLEQAPLFNQNPVCKIYYVTTGRWNSNDVNLMSRFHDLRDSLETQNLFSRIDIFPFGGSEIQKLYQSSKAKNTAEIVFETKVLLPDVEGINEAHVGNLPFSEFKKLIIDSEGNLKPVFDENVRAFQGLKNKVNKDIEQTLRLGKFDRFAILNNGITVVAKHIKSSRNKFYLSDYQIINGCQTSHILYENKDLPNIDSQLFVPIKIIATEDERLIKEITIATNNQTTVKTEELASLSEFQRRLELYYCSRYTPELKLYYERRSKQYESEKNIKKTHVISIQQQIKSFAGMFLEEPHRVARSYGSLLKELLSETKSGPRTLFNFDHKDIVYYTTGLALFKLETLFRNNQIDSKYKKSRYHLLLVMRHLHSDASLPPFNSKKIDEYCEALITSLSNPKTCLALFSKAVRCIEAVGVNPKDYDNFRTADTTKRLVIIAKEMKNK